jgi:DNA-binding CsgD family transcriptional regulator
MEANFDERARPATMADVLELVSRSKRSFVVIRLPEATVAAANAAALELFGRTATTVIGRHASSMYRGADEVYVNIALSALAAGAINSFTARRRLASRAGAGAWTHVRRLEVADGVIALGLTVPVEEPRPRDAVEDELARSTDIDWGSPVPLPSAADGHGSGGMWQPTTESPFEVLDRLPNRQREIVAALLQGQRTKVIAASLYVSSSTVRSHLSLIFKAFGVRSQTDLLSLLRSEKSSSDGTAPPNR